jgi:hypothetical protein
MQPSNTRKLMLESFFGMENYTPLWGYREKEAKTCPKIHIYSVIIGLGKRCTQIFATERKKFLNRPIDDDNKKLLRHIIACLFYLFALSDVFAHCDSV